MTIIGYIHIEFPLICKIRYIELSDYIELLDHIELSDFIELSDYSKLYPIDSFISLTLNARRLSTSSAIHYH